MKALTFIIISMAFNFTAFGFGCIKGDCTNGQGIYKYSDNTIYIGSFVNGLANGYGRCYYQDGQKYMGQWAEHTYHGKGTYDNGKGQMITGIWNKGELVETNTDEIEVKKEAAIPKIYAVIIGIADYPNLSSLKYTDDDAYRIYSFMGSPEGGAVPAEQMSVIIDGEATRENILNTSKTIFDKAGEEDMILFYFSGHGLEDAILPYDYNGSKNKVLYKELYEILENNKAKHKVCIIDACHSGGMMAAKGINDVVPNTAQIYYEHLKNTKGGTAIITSSKQEEVSIENTGLRQGIFSHFWIKALKGTADVNADKVVTISEAFYYVQKNVKSYSLDYQTPQLDGTYDAKLPLSVIR
jgi:hypothetical protein